VYLMAAVGWGAAPVPVTGKPVSHEEVLKGFQHVHPKAQDIIRHGKDWKPWVLCDRKPVKRWVDGRVALLGDAAHSMRQYFAQGACMAMEDAVCLAHMVVQLGQVEEALERYAGSPCCAPPVSSCNRARSERTSTIRPRARPARQRHADVDEPGRHVRQPGLALRWNRTYRGPAGAAGAVGGAHPRAA
jgi:hypothetical protein